MTQGRPVVPQMIGIKEAAKTLGLSTQTLRKLARERTIGSYKPNARLILFSISEINDFLNRCERTRKIVA